jgi:outer membrane immunogenic protein
MKTSLTLSAAALALSAVAASAADLPARAPAAAPVVPYVAPIFTWSGFYVGLNAGAGWSGNNNCPTMHTYTGGVVGAVVTSPAYAAPCDNSSSAAFTGGAQAGFNWQLGSVVLGVEGDINYLGDTGQSGYGNYLYNSVTTGNTTTNYYYNWNGNRNGNMLGSLRARGGIAFDRALIYITGGLAFRNANHDDVIYAANTVGGTAVATYYGNNGSDNTGWALGGGLEWALTNNMSFKVEYLHSHFGNDSNIYTTTSTTAPYNTVAFVGDRNDKVDVVRVGINWRFGGPTASAAPVLARY